MQRRQEILDDITDTTGAVFLGLTYGCARCHNHKFDPILQKDYYRLQAFFANTARRRPHPHAAGRRSWPNTDARSAAWEAKTSDIRAEIAALLEPAKQKPRQGVLRQVPARDPGDDPEAARPSARPIQWQMYAKAKPYLEIADEDAAKQLQGRTRRSGTTR